MDGSGRLSDYTAQRRHEQALSNFTRTALSLIHSRGQAEGAAEFAEIMVRSGEWKSTPSVGDLMSVAQDRMLHKEIMKGAAETMLPDEWSDWQSASGAFVALVRAQSVVGKLPAARIVPFNRTASAMTKGIATAGWVGRGAPKPVGVATFAALALEPLKVSGLYIVSRELARQSDAETILSNDLSGAVRERMDATFCSDDAASMDESPAGIAQACQTVASTGASGEKIQADLSAMVDALGVSLRSACWITSPEAAARLAFMKITDAGGTLGGLPLIVSSASEGSMLLVASEFVVLAIDNAATLSVSEQAAVQLDDSPTTGEQTLLSLWQNDLVALKSEIFCNWELTGRVDTNGDSLAVVALTSATWV
jgi:hypothetical protein